MADKPINLRDARKAKQRAEKRARGDENSAKFGRTKTEKAKTAATLSLDKGRLDGHKLDP